MDLHLAADAVTRERLEQLKGLLEGAPGSCSVVLHLSIPKRSETLVPLSPSLKVQPSDELLLSIERLFGARVAQLR